MRQHPSPDATQNWKCSARQYRMLMLCETDHSTEEIAAFDQRTLQSLLQREWVVKRGSRFVRSGSGDQVVYDYATLNVMRKRADAALCAFLREPVASHPRTTRRRASGVVMMPKRRVAAA